MFVLNGFSCQLRKPIHDFIVSRIVVVGFNLVIIRDTLDIITSLSEVGYKCVRALARVRICVRHSSASSQYSS